jgi:hypothetical protein
MDLFCVWMDLFCVWNHHRRELFGHADVDKEKQKIEDLESSIFRKEFESLENTLRVSEESRQKGQISLVELERQTGTH